MWLWARDCEESHSAAVENTDNELSMHRLWQFFSSFVFFKWKVSQYAACDSENLFVWKSFENRIGLDVMHGWKMYFHLVWCWRLRTALRFCSGMLRRVWGYNHNFICYLSEVAVKPFTCLRQGVVLKNPESFCYFSNLSERKSKYTIETDGIEFWSEDNLMCK